MWKFWIFMELEPYSYYLVITDPLDMSHVKYKWAYLNQYSPMKRYQSIYVKTKYILYNMGERYWVNSSYLWSFSHVSNIWYHQYTESESWEMKIGVDGPILTQKKTLKALWDNNIHTLQDGRKCYGTSSYLWS